MQQEWSCVFGGKNAELQHCKPSALAVNPYGEAQHIEERKQKQWLGDI